MRILHITDFHFRNNEKHIPDQNNILASLLKSLKSESKIDFFFFTGDMVFSGARYEDFLLVQESLIKKICKEIGVKKENIFICAGNHDVNRGQELEDITESLKRVDSSQKLEDYLKKQDGRSFEESLANLRNYLKFQEEFYSEFGDPEKDVLKKLHTIHKRTHERTRIGVVTLNSAWRALNSHTDRGNLLFPISILKEATEEIKRDTDFRILLMHHPISDFKDWNSFQMEDIIHHDYHMMFSGHVHKKHQSIQICSDEGIFCCVSPATLCTDDGAIGYSIIDVDLETFDISISNRSFVKEDKQFYKAPEPLLTTIPVNAEKREQNEFRKTLRKKLLNEIDRANELFISYGDTESRTFLELFTEPILKAKTQAQIASRHSDIPNVSINEITCGENNLVIYGKDKSGKTSILYKILIEQLSSFAANKTIPIFINCKDFRNVEKLDLIQAISKYYEVNKNKAADLANSQTICLLLDNYDPTNESINIFINDFLKQYHKTRFIASTEETLHTQFSLFNFNGKNYNTLFIHEISRPEIRMLTNKWPNLTPERRELILEKIFTIFHQMNIPSNFWTVSLFIWIFEKNNDTNFHNSFELIQLYIENLLDRKRLALDKSSKIDFEDFKTFLGALAHHLVVKYHGTSYSMSYTELVSFTESYRKSNRRFVIPVEDIIALIIDKNVLRKANDERYTFRLNGVFEYFIAFYMKDDEQFRDEIIENDHFYLSFGNELELCSGFNKRDRTLLEKVYKKTEKLFQPLFEDYSATTIDKLLISKISEVFSFQISLHELKSKFSDGLTEEKQDKYFKEIQKMEIKSEVEKKPFYDQIDQNSQNLEKALFILSRVFRNSSVNEEDFNNKVLDFILNASCYLGFKMIDDADEDDEFIKEILTPENEEVFAQLVLNFMPLIVQVFLYDALAQNNLERIFTDKIEELKRDSKNNQFKLAVLYLTLIDLDLKSHKKYIDEVIDLVEIGILKQTTIIKLYLYLLFKCNGNKQLEDLIKKKIQEQTLKIDPKTDRGLLQQGIAKASKMLMLNNRKNKKNGKPRKK